MMFPNEWPHAVVYEDIRTPLWSTTHYDVYFLSLWFWLEIALVCILEAMIGALCGALLYAFVLLPRKLRKHPHVTPTDCVWVFGIVIPFWIFCPNPVMNALGVHNQIFRFCMGTITPTLSMFRATQALFGFAPISDSLGSYAFQYGSPLLVQIDATTGQWKRASWASTGRKFMDSRMWIFATGALQSCLYCFDSYFPSFHYPRPEHYYSFEYVTLRRISDNFWLGLLVMVYLTAFCDGLAFLTMLLTGYETQPVMRNPLFGSASPSEFWGRRWNCLIHDCLKQGVYKPIRSLGGSHAVGVLGAFVASGAFHEWLLETAFPTVVPVHGPTLFFFLWQVVLVVMEQQVEARWKLFSTLRKKLPRPLLSLLVILLALPIGHLFLDSYIHSAFFEHGSLLLPIVRPVGTGLTGKGG
ncbi:hypothetical protein FisN_19Hh276 [Fistulifera solaris]|uniref:Wax synthase domain-containing protein n=1 Tax=Fistulifera solaris TaxID=1519565 RepID=A0A1Z5K050_FISSO|nr:hypothetical protein FisN_19Hh276 [Fistulifera solaris]|eukprot:GAX19690.1 hypothetical protein FisN_19Hh276 [Fistulifera solaris]